MKIFLFGNAVWMVLCVGTGCRTTPAPAPVVPPVPTAREHPLHLTTAGSDTPLSNADRNIVGGDLEVIVQADIYQLTVPFGAISSNQLFWNHVDEDRVDLSSHDLLLKNGVRLGIGATSEWAYFKDLLDHYGSAARRGFVSPSRKGKLELSLKSEIDFEDIFYLPIQGTLYGRSYEKCDNVLCLTFEPTPRRTDSARIEACAVVRGLRKQFEVTVLNDEREIELKRPEFLYDLRVSQDVPPDHFLVIAPSSLSNLPDNLGHTFLVNEGGAAPTETVLILVPHTHRVTRRANVIPLEQVRK